MHLISLSLIQHFTFEIQCCMFTTGTEIKKVIEPSLGSDAFPFSQGTVYHQHFMKHGACNNHESRKTRKTMEEVGIVHT